MKTPTALLACLLAALPAATLAGNPQHYSGGGGEHGYTRSAPAQRSSYQQQAPRQSYAPRENSAPRQNYAPRQSYAPRENYAPRQNYAPRESYAPRYSNTRVAINSYGGRSYAGGRFYGWAPEPAYWGGGFWGSLTIGLAPSAYVVQADSPGADLLAQYGLQQTDCNQPNLVSIQGPDGGEICAYPNDQVAPGQYSVDLSNMTLVSE